MCFVLTCRARVSVPRNVGLPWLYGPKDWHSSMQTGEIGYGYGTDSRQILKEIELFKPHGLKFDRNFPCLEAEKVEKPVID